MSTPLPHSTFVSPNEFLYVPPPSVFASEPSTDPQTRPHGRRRRLIYYITGNPGLISYYHEFLSLLANDLPEWAVYGRSLYGFETSAEVDGSKQAKTRGNATAGFKETDLSGIGVPTDGRPLSLQQQLEISKRRFRDVTEAISSSSNDEEQQQVSKEEPLQVVIMGHSVGAWIAMEIIKEYHHAKVGKKTKQNPTGGSTLSDLHHTVDLDMAILLTPTITHIASSSSGRVATPILTNIPYADLGVQSLVNLLTTCLSTKVLQGITSFVMGRPPTAGLETTVQFLQTPGAVRQALYMARDEMHEIAEDRWEDLWWKGGNDSNSISHGETITPTKLVLFFAQQDHWVDNACRDAMIQHRGSGGRGAKQGADNTTTATATTSTTATTAVAVPDADAVHILAERDGNVAHAGAGQEDEELHEIKRPGPTFVVEETGEMVHGFCIRHSGFVAKKVVDWIRERYSISSE